LSLEYLKINGGSIIATYREPHNRVEITNARLHQLSFDSTLIKEMKIRGSTGYVKIIRTTIGRIEIYECKDLTIEFENANLLYVKIKNCQEIFLKQSQYSDGEVKIFSKLSNNITVYFESGILTLEAEDNRKLKINIPKRGRGLLICDIEIRNSSVEDLRVGNIKSCEGEISKLSIKEISVNNNKYPKQNNIEKYLP
jgi:hypothetical protein